MTNPMVSAKDQAFGKLADIPRERLPTFGGGQ